MLQKPLKHITVPKQNGEAGGLLFNKSTVRNRSSGIEA